MCEQRMKRKKERKMWRFDCFLFFFITKFQRKTTKTLKIQIFFGLKVFFLPNLQRKKGVFFTVFGRTANPDSVKARTLVYIRLWYRFGSVPLT